MTDSEKIAILKDLINGEWVDCDKVQEALSIDFSTGLKMFDFSRTAEWNPYPLNGQKITIKFRLKTPKNAVKKFAEKLKEDSRHFFVSTPFVEHIDLVAEEMMGEIV